MKTGKSVFDGFGVNSYCMLLVVIVEVKKTQTSRQKKSSTFSPLLAILESLLSNSIHCWTTRLTVGSELLTSWKPVILAPPFLRSVKSMSKKP